MNDIGHTFSASQISTYLQCPRKWAWTHIEKVPVTPHPSAVLGTEVHKQIEEWYDKGTELDYTREDRAGLIAGELLPYLPSGQPDHLEVEAEFMLQGRHKYYGLIDLRDSATHTIYDHKSTSNLKWAKATEDLRHDVQALIYATTSMVEWGVPEVNLQWTYTQTKGALRALPVRLTLRAEDVAPLFAVIEDVADEMLAHIVQKKRALDLVPEPKMCSAYGGCPFQHLCNLSPSERMRSVMNPTSTEDLLARLSKKNSIEPGQINPPESALPAPTPPPAPVEAPKAQKKAKEAKKEATPAIPRARIGTLYIDCAPDDNNWVGFDAILGTAIKILRETDFKQQDGKIYRVRDYREVQWGQGPAALCMAIQQCLEALVRVEELMIFSTTPESQTCLYTLIQNADRTVR